MNVLISLIVSIIVLLGLIGIAIFGNTLPSIGLGIICFVLIICFSISYKELTSFLLKKQIK